MEATIRDATPADLDRLRVIFREASLSNAGDRSFLVANPDALELTEAPVHEGRTRVVVVDGGTIAGFSSFVPAGGALEIEDLFVEPARMRRGLGRMLVDDLLALARGRGVTEVVVSANPHALAFYERAGFTVERYTETRFGQAAWMRQLLTRPAG